jgi:hypothetical protein
MRNPKVKNTIKTTSSCHCFFLMIPGNSMLAKIPKRVKMIKVVIINGFNQSLPI